MQERAFMIEMAVDHPYVGHVMFESLQLPATDYEIRDALQKMRATKDMIAPQEYSIYNCQILPQLNDVRLDTATLDELNFLAKRLMSLDTDEAAILKAVASKMISTEEGELVSIKDLINLTYGTGTVSVLSNVGNDIALGEFVIETGMQGDVASVPDNATYLLDKAQIGRLQREMDGGVFVGNLYVCTDHFEMPKVYDGITLPEVEPEEWFAFRLLVAKPPKGSETNYDSAEWIRLPVTQMEMEHFAKEHNGVPLTKCVYYDFESSIPQITGEDFPSMEDIGKLNSLAHRMLGMSPEQQVKFKAVLEVERQDGITLDGMNHVAQNLHRYEFSNKSDTPGAFACVR